MRIPSHADAFEVLLLQAGDEGRGTTLFGESFSRARTAVRPFLTGDAFPDVYLEFPLKGDPFLDVTVLYDGRSVPTRADSAALAGAGAAIEWFAEASPRYDDICFGFELDTSKEELPRAAVHFQPREHTELVRPFCEALGEPWRADLYLALDERMPTGWPLAFFGMFRGRPGAPLRVCGYLGADEKLACAKDPSRLARVFDGIGFTAYDDPLLNQAAKLMAAAPSDLDFQFDVYPDGRLGTVFAFDVRFDARQPAAVREAFGNGPVADVMSLLEAWGAADRRWRLAADTAFASALPVELDGGRQARFAFTLMPQWVKVRWSDGMLQPSKLYLLANAGPIKH